MFRLIALGLFSTAVTIAGQMGYSLYSKSIATDKEQVTIKKFEDVKTDFISVAVFKDGKVTGYLSFRTVLTLRDPSRLREAGFYIADALHRKLSDVAVLVGDQLDPEIASVLAKPVQEALTVGLGVDEVGKIELVDLAFDRRITPDG